LKSGRRGLSFRVFGEFARVSGRSQSILLNRHDSVHEMSSAIDETWRPISPIQALDLGDRRARFRLSGE